MTRILKVLPANMAVVSTEGMQRVLVEATGEVVEELVPAARASKLVDEHNKHFQGPATAVDYSSLTPVAPEPGLDGEGNVRIIATLPGCAVVSTRGLQQLRYANGELYLELLDEESAADLRDKHNSEGGESEYHDPIYAVDYDTLAQAESEGVEWQPDPADVEAAEAIVAKARAERPTVEAAAKEKRERETLRVLDVAPGRIVISNEGLYRVVDLEDGHTVADLETEDQAARYVESWASMGRKAIAVSYAAMAGETPLPAEVERFGKQLLPA